MDSLRVIYTALWVVMVIRSISPMVGGAILGLVTYLVAGGKVYPNFALLLLVSATLLWLLMMRYCSLFRDTRSLTHTTTKLLGSYILVAGLLTRTAETLVYALVILFSFVVSILLARLFYPKLLDPQPI